MESSLGSSPNPEETATTTLQGAPIEAQQQHKSWIEFAVAEDRIEVAESYLAPLLSELEKLDREAAAYEAAAAAARIRQGCRALTLREPLELSRAEAWAMLRAIEHLRRFAPLAVDLLRLRDRLQADLGLAASRVGYLVCDRERHEREEHFTSFSGPYATGDRLVTTDGRAWQIRHVEVAAPSEPGRLFVEPWTMVPVEAPSS